MFARIGLPVVSMRVVQLVRLPKMSVRVYRSAVHSQTYRKHIARTSARHVAPHHGMPCPIGTAEVVSQNERRLCFTMGFVRLA